MVAGEVKDCHREEEQADQCGDAERDQVAPVSYTHLYLTHEETSGIQNRPWVKPEVILGLAGRKLDPAPAATVTKSEIFYDEFK